MRTFAALLVAVLVAMAGCGAPTPSGTGSVVEVRLEVVGDRVTGAGPRIAVSRGDLVRLTVRSDRADELHVHGYDRTLGLPAGADATLEFVADLPGVFEVELHGAGTALPSLEVR